LNTILNCRNGREKKRRPIFKKKGTVIGCEAP